MLALQRIYRPDVQGGCADRSSKNHIVGERESPGGIFIRIVECGYRLQLVLNPCTQVVSLEAVLKLVVLDD